MRFSLAVGLIVPLLLVAQPDERQVVVVSDGQRDILELRLGRGPERITNARPADSQNRMLSYSAYHQNGRLLVKLGVPVDENDRSMGLELGIFTLPDNGDPLSTDAAARFGYPVLQFRVATTPEKCTGDIQQVHLPPSLHVEALVRDKKTPDCNLVLKNTKQVPVISYGVEFRDDKHRVVTSVQKGLMPPAVLTTRRAESREVTMGGPTKLMADKESERLVVHAFSAPPGGAGDLGERQFIMTYCIFEDGSYEGSAEEVRAQVAVYAGMAANLSRVLAVVKGLPPKADQASLSPIVHAEIARLPLTDPAAEEVVIARLAPSDPEHIRDNYRSGLDSFSARLLDKFPGPEDEAHYWIVRSEMFTSILERLQRVLRPWMGD
jgi:hypothetical protein